MTTPPLMLSEHEPGDLLKDVKLAKVLLKIDEETAKKSLKAGCQNPKCKHKKLYSGNYKRNTERCAPEVKQYYEIKFSANCAVCDKRVTPPSVRFLAGTWRSAISLVLTTARGARSVSWLASHLDVPESTVKRWRRWWRRIFAATQFWDFHRAGFLPPVDPQQLPGSALVCCQGSSNREKLVLFLQFLCPLRTRGSR